jgi:hypothetical protein
MEKPMLSRGPNPAQGHSACGLAARDGVTAERPNGPRRSPWPQQDRSARAKAAHGAPEHVVTAATGGMVAHGVRAREDGMSTGISWEIHRARRRRRGLTEASGRRGDGGFTPAAVASRQQPARRQLGAGLGAV